MSLSAVPSSQKSNYAVPGKVVETISSHSDRSSLNSEGKVNKSWEEFVTNTHDQKLEREKNPVDDKRRIGYEMETGSHTEGEIRRTTDPYKIIFTSLITCTIGVTLAAIGVISYAFSNKYPD